MIRKAEEMRSENIESMRDGNGEVQVTHILEKNEFNNKGRLFARNLLKPGTSIGFHQHVGDFESYYIIKGEGVLDDNGIKKPIKAGDLGYTENGQGHSIENTANTDLEFISLVLYD